MSAPTYVVVPVQSEGAQHSEPDSDKIASAIQESLNEKTYSHPLPLSEETRSRPELETAHPEGHDIREQKQSGPLKEIIARQDSLYKYISWEDPVRTLGSYIGALSVLFGAHYIPLTQYALKAAATILGVISVAEFASRFFGPNTFLARLRPKEYKKVPESALSATLKDIHDFVQWAVVQAQKIIWGQDLDNTFAAFLGFAVLYWLINVLPPFWLAVLGLTSLFVAPIFTSRRGRAAAQDGIVRAQELTSAAAEKGNSLTRGGKDTAVELSSKAQETAANTGRRIGGVAQSGKQTAANLSSQTQNTAADVSTQARNTASSVPEATAENVRELLGKVN